MSQSISALTFNGVTLSPVSHKNQTWLSSVELAKALGYAREDSVSRIFDRNQDEFNDSMTILRDRQIDVLGESSGLQTTQRIFSLRGCHLISMFAKTAIAKQFRAWVLDVLDKEVSEPKPYGLKDQPKPETVEDIKRKVIARWMVLVDIFGNQLINEYGLKVSKVWGEEFETMTEAQFKRGIQGIKNSKSPFMPRLPVFLAYCNDDEVVKALPKNGEVIDKKKEIAMPCESRADILKHIDYFETRISAFNDLLGGMERSAKIIKGALAA